MEPLLIRPEEAGKLVGLSRGRIYELLAAGEIGSIKEGNARLIIYESLKQWVERRRAAQSATSDADDASGTSSIRS